MNYSTRFQFNQMKEPHTALYPFARDVRSGQVVRLPGERLKSGEVHFEKKLHKGHLTCSDCDARIHYVPEKKAGGGSNTPGSREHFAANPKQNHAENCKVGERRLAIEQSERPEINKSHGFQINLNTLDQRSRHDMRYDFRRAHGPYQRDGRDKTRYRTDAENLKHMENVAVSDARDLVRFLRTKPMQRIRDSVVIHLNNEIQWRFFMISYGNKGEKFKLLTSWMRDHGTKQQPVLMEVLVTEGMKPGNNRIASPVIDYKDNTGRAARIVPSVYLDNDDFELRHSFAEPGHYLVLGHAKLSTRDFSDGRTHFLSISVTDTRQVIKANLRDIRIENERHQNRLNMRGGPAPGTFS